jgi:hypothetical protein
VDTPRSQARDSVQGRLESFGADVAYRTVPAYSSVEHFDVLEDRQPRILPRGVPLMVHQFRFQRAPETFFAGLS